MAFTDMYLYFDDVEVGQEWESQGRTITETDIVNFAGISGDFNPIHVDHEFAKTTPFRRPIAHGMLVLSMGSGLGVHSPPMRTVAFMQVREWNLREPVYIGDTLRMRTRILSKTLRGRGRRGEIAWYRNIINQEGKTVQDGIIVTLVEGRGRKSQETETPVAATADATEPGN